MKRAEIRTKAEAFLKLRGFGADDYLWSGANLILNVGGRMQPIRMQSGITARDFSFRLGIITGIAMALDIKPRTDAKPAARINRKGLNGSAARLNGSSPAGAHA